MNRRSLFAFAFATLGLAACGGADSAPAKSGASVREEAPPEPKTVEEAQKQIADAVADLNGRSALKASDQPKAEPAPTAGGNAPREEYSADAAMNQCVSPCRALASMKRAVEALCRMTGEADTKCVDARKTLADNVGKTASCKCN